MVEQNLITAFLLASLKRYPDSLWGVEVPFAGAPQQKPASARPPVNNQPSKLSEKDVLGEPWKNHIDAFIYLNETLYFIEAKRDYPAETFLQHIKADYERIKSPELAVSFRLMMNRSGVYREPFGAIKQVKGILLADTWRPNNLKLWTNGYYKAAGQKQASDLSWLKSLERDSHPLDFKSGASESYSLLIAQTADLERSRKIINNEL
ncbi:hypothetical protein [Idiomarina sp. HP20-50]|uniref:hypothetical protein n=1 Tax=Idiomarina sp. HP20-50 TaxID=3070813 RepID=UPI00294AB8F4|nr:hypothetical protein [Idiomarina sp. HP20-50]MDV6316461.1 hypothetical protein [Idiomarina sp. HP20-50]